MWGVVYIFSSSHHSYPTWSLSWSSASRPWTPTHPSHRSPGPEHVGNSPEQPQQIKIQIQLHRYRYRYRYRDRYIDVSGTQTQMQKYLGSDTQIQIYTDTDIHIYYDCLVRGMLPRNLLVTLIYHRQILDYWLSMTWAMNSVMRE